jgi:hypothetical protein
VLRHFDRKGVTFFPCAPATRVKGQRLDIVAEKLGKRNQAAEELQRLKSPLHTMRRWFSEEAREHLKDVESVIAREGENLRLYGTTSEAELQQQRQMWERDRARVPAFEQRLGALAKGRIDPRHFCKSVFEAVNVIATQPDIDWRHELIVDGSMPARPLG